jgi:methyl coenzyme M reductase gamma subunit
MSLDPKRLESAERGLAAGALTRYIADYAARPAWNVDDKIARLAAEHLAAGEPLDEAEFCELEQAVYNVAMDAERAGVLAGEGRPFLALYDRIHTLYTRR